MYHLVFFFLFYLWLCEPRQSSRYAETTIIMAPNVGDEAPHNSFDVRTTIIIRRAKMTSSETHLFSLSKFPLITVKAQSISKKGLANTWLSRLFSSSISAYVSDISTNLPLCPSFGPFQITELHYFCRAPETAPDGKCWLIVEVSNESSYPTSTSCSRRLRWAASVHH